MPESVDIMDNLVEDFIRIEGVKCQRFLDIGAGTGKYGKLIRKHSSSATLEAVEIDSEYIVNYRLADIYDGIYNVDVEKFITQHVDSAWDVVIMGDVLEHLKKSVGIDILNFFVYRTKWIVAVFPVGMPQGSWAGRRQEAHISVWDEQDFSPFKYTYLPKSFMRLVYVEGYLK